MENDEKGLNSHDEEEGRITRNLFRTDSDSSDSDSNTVESLEKRTEIRQIRVGDIVLEEKQEGGLISERLWPAAQRLANYVMNLQTFQPDTTSSINTNPPLTSKAVSIKTRLAEALKNRLALIELGAGVGLTGLLLATQLPVRVLLTDTKQGVVMLQRNLIKNQSQFPLPKSVQVQELCWGNSLHYESALQWYREDPSSEQLLLLGSDVVYWEELQQPLEHALFHLLQGAPPGTMALLAGMRRWKRDTQFFHKILGRNTRTPTQQLCCTLLDEFVSRRSDSNNDEEEQREICRIYAVTLETIEQK